MRSFSSGANRDTAYGKFEYYGFIDPKCDYSFAKYMHRFREQPDGTIRASDNWKRGIPRRVLLESLIRHTEDIKLIYSGYFVYEKREGKYAERIVVKKPLAPLPKNVHEITFEDACNGVRFNEEAMKLQWITKHRPVL